MKLLLHTCCGPCLIHPFKFLKEKSFEVQGYFYNPNIHPFTEYRNRRDAVKKAADYLQAEVVYPEYNFEEFFRVIADENKALQRCKKCWQLRLEKTAETASKNGFEYFSSTLLVSPYQDVDAIKEIGNKAAEKHNVKFFFEDFRPGFREAHKEAKENDIYCQKYCGCLYSEQERYDK